MTNSDVVRVAVEIVDNFSDELTTLESRLEKIDGKNLDVDLDIDDGDIETVKGKLEALEKELNATLDIDVSGYTRAKAKKEYLERDMHSTLHLGVEQDRLPNLGNLNGGNGFNPPKTPEGPEINTSSISDVNFPAIDDNKLTNKGNLSPDEKEVVNDFLINPSVAKLHNKGIPKEDRDGWIGPSNWAFGIDEQFGPSNTNDRTPAETNFLSNIKKATESSTSLEIGDDLFSNSKFGDLEIQAKGFDSDLFAPKSLRSLNDYQFGIDHTVGKDMPRMSSSFVKNDDDGLFERIGKSRLNSMRSVNLPSIGIFGSDDDGLNEKIKSLIPTMQKWYRLVALVIPLLITMAGAALGAAAALGALAGVGAAMVGIGLLGYGDSLSESLRNAQKRTQQLKEELFDVFQPVAGVFQPFVEQLFGKIPRVAKQLTEPLKNLEASGFDNFFIDALEGTGNFLADLIRLINQLAPEIQSIGAGLGRVFGDILLGLLQWSVKELYNNWEAFAKLGSIILSIIIVLYNLSKAVSFALAVFEPLFSIIAKISSLVGNKATAVLLAAAAGFAATALTVYGLVKALTILQSVWAGSVLSTIYAGIIALQQYIVTALTAIGVSATLAATLATLTIALGAIIGAGVAAYAAYEFIDNSGNNSSGSSSPSPSGFGSPSPTGGNSGGTQINIYGDVGRDEYQRMKDEFPDMYREQSEIDEETER